MSALAAGPATCTGPISRRWCIQIRVLDHLCSCTFVKWWNSCCVCCSCMLFNRVTPPTCLRTFACVWWTLLQGCALLECVNMAAEQDNPDLPVAFNVVDRVRPHTGDDHPISWFVAITTYFGYAVLVMFGQIRDFFGKFTGSSRYFGANLRPKKVGVHSRACVGSACVPLMTGLCFHRTQGYAPLLKDWENFYTRYVASCVHVVPCAGRWADLLVLLAAAQPTVSSHPGLLEPPHRWPTHSVLHSRPDAQLHR